MGRGVAEERAKEEGRGTMRETYAAGKGGKQKDRQEAGAASTFAENTWRHGVLCVLISSNLSRQWGTDFKVQQHDGLRLHV